VLCLRLTFVGYGLHSQGDSHLIRVCVCVCVCVCAPASLDSSSTCHRTVARRFLAALAAAAY
jgi:hypothetical protein